MKNPGDSITLLQYTEMTDAFQPETMKAFRVAFRTEGDFVNAYLAQNDSLKDALLLGSLYLGLANNQASLKAFQTAIATGVSDVVAHVFGVRPSFKEEAAPEHEITKNA